MFRTRTLLTLAAVASVAVVSNSASAAFITPTGATASIFYVPDGRTPEDTINPAHLSTNDISGTHGGAAPEMWLNNGGGAAGEWIRFDLGASYDLTKIYIWNYNENHAVNTITDRGVQDFTVEVSTDDINWSNPITGANQTASQINLPTGYEAQTPVTDILDMTAAGVQYVRFNLISSYGDNYVGLSEVRFEGVVPEPTSLALLGLGGLLIARRRRG